MKPILSAQELSAHLADPSWAVVDCRFDLMQPDWGRQDFEKAHIPGSLYADLNRDLAAPHTAHTGRHPLPNILLFRQFLAAQGLSPEKTIVMVDTAFGAFASRLWWMLHQIGYTNIAILDGGWAQWQKSGLPVESGPASPVPQPLSTIPEFTTFGGLSLQEVDHIRLSPLHKLIDARAPIRFQGKEETIDPVAGHIPGALNRFHSQNLTSEGLFKSPQELHAEFSQLLAGTPSENAAVYCGSGVTSCFHLVAMKYAGLQLARLYPGSWSEWILDPHRPIAVGE